MTETWGFNLAEARCGEVESKLGFNYCSRTVAGRSSDTSSRHEMEHRQGQMAETVKGSLLELFIVLLLFLC